jgi:hypothetical protein
MTLYRLETEGIQPHFWGERFDVKQRVYWMLARGVDPADMSLYEVGRRGLNSIAQPGLLTNIVKECIILQEG